MEHDVVIQAHHSLLKFHAIKFLWNMAQTFQIKQRQKNILELHGILPQKNEEHIIDMAIQMGL